MRVYLALTILTISVIGCSSGYEVASTGDQTGQGQNPPTPDQPPGGKPSDPNKCWTYSKYELVPCTALTARSSLSGAEKTAYAYPASSDARYRAPVWLIDLKKISTDVNVTRNFQLSEFVSIAKGRYAFVAEHLFTFVQLVRDKLGAALQVTSGYRSPQYNKGQGGVSFSRHVYGDAVDIASPSASLKQMQTACRAANASYIQLYNDGHIHCDWRNHALDSTFFQTTRPQEVSTELSDVSDEEFKEQQAQMNGEVSVAILEGEARAGQSITLITSVAEQEDPEMLHAEWKITSPNGTVQNLEGNPLNLKLGAAGTYRLEVIVGGYSEVADDLIVR